jgi:hypothetical protein
MSVCTQQRLLQVLKVCGVCTLQKVTHSCRKFQTSIFAIFAFLKVLILGLQLVEALCYKPEVCEFYSRLGHWHFLLIKSFRSHYDPWCNWTCNRDEYRQYLVGVKVADAWGSQFPASCADLLEILRTSNSCISRGLFRSLIGKLYFPTFTHLGCYAV